MEEELFEAINNRLSKQILDKLDNDITYVLNVVRKQIEELSIMIPYSKAKAQRRANLIY